MAELEDLKVPEGIDPAKAIILIRWLIEIENENGKTGQFSNATMAKEFRVTSNAYKIDYSRKLSALPGKTNHSFLN